MPLQIAILQPLQHWPRSDNAFDLPLIFRPFGGRNYDTFFYIAGSEPFFSMLPRLSKTKGNVVTIHLGAYFRGDISTMGGFFALLSAGALIYVLSTDVIEETGGRALTIVGLVLFMAASIHILLGIEGVEFHLNENKFRHYKKMLFVKAGKWRNLDNYPYLCLSAQYNSGSSMSFTETSGTRHRSLEINLASPTRKAILLAECKNYREAEKCLHQLNALLNREVKNFVFDHYRKLGKV